MRVIADPGGRRLVEIDQGLRPCAWHTCAVVSIVTWFLAGVATSLAGGAAYLAVGSLPLAALVALATLALLARRLP